MPYPRDVANVLRDIAQALATGRQPEDVQAERHARERTDARLPEPVTVRPGGVTITLNRARVAHQPADGCVNHCYSHHLDETDQAYLWCGECFHAFPTARALRWDWIRGALGVIRSDLRNPHHWARTVGGPVASRLDALARLVRLPFTRTRDITFCPFCIHDL
jgi:hypothetical protein